MQGDSREQTGVRVDGRMRVRISGRARAPETPVAPVRGAGTLAGNHARTHRRFRRAGAAEQPAVLRALDATYWIFRAFAGLVIGHGARFGREAAFGVEVPQADLMRSALYGTRPSPRQSKCCAAQDTSATSFCLAVAVAADRAREFVLDAALSGVDLAHEHAHGLQHVERLEAGDDDRLRVFGGEVFVRAAADHGRDVRRADEAVGA